MRVASELVALDLQLLGIGIAKRVELRLLGTRWSFGLRGLGRLGVVVAFRAHESESSVIPAVRLHTLVAHRGSGSWREAIA
jgi:hypothetical protein